MSQSTSIKTYPSLFDRAIVLTGPTASGKSSLAMRLAKQIGGEILSLDSIAVYRHMDIGTAKPEAADREKVPHHLLDLAEPNQDFSVACYLEEAHRTVDAVISRGNRPIFVGGTPMFLKAVLRGFDPGPPPDWDFRESVERDLEVHGIDALRKRLRQVDPLAASRIAASDARRMIRALEVAKHTGVPMSHRQVHFDHAVNSDDCNVFAICHERSMLHQRINLRVEQMVARGLFDEVQLLMDRYGSLSRTASQAVGYREIIEWHQEGARQDSIDTVVEKIAAHTRQLARRQETWFRSFSEITRLQVNEFADEDAMLGVITRHVDSTC